MLKKLGAATLSALVVLSAFGPAAASAVAAEISAKTAPTVRAVPVVTELPALPASLPQLGAVAIPALPLPLSLAAPELVGVGAIAPGLEAAAPFAAALQRLESPSLVGALPSGAGAEAAGTAARGDFATRVLGEAAAAPSAESAAPRVVGAPPRSGLALSARARSRAAVPAKAQARSVVFPAAAGGVLGAAAGVLKVAAVLLHPISALGVTIAAGAGVVSTALTGAAWAVAVPAAVLFARAVFEAAQYAVAVRRGRNVTDAQFKRFVEGEVLAGRLDGGVARLIKIHRPEGFAWDLGLGYHSSGAIWLRPELAASPALFGRVLAHEFKHYQELKSRGPPAKGGWLGRLWRRAGSELAARAVELKGAKALKDVKVPALERALREAQLSLNLDQPYPLLVVNASSPELKDAALYENLSSGRARVESVATAEPQRLLAEPKNAGRYRAVVLDKPDALVPAAESADGRRLDRALKQLDNLYLLATRRIAGAGADFGSTSESQRYRELGELARKLGGKKEAKELDRLVKDFWRQIASTRLKGIPVSDFIETLYAGLQNKGLAFLSFDAKDPGVIVWEKLLRYWEAADGGEFRTVRVDLEDGGHIMILRKVEARVGLWLRPVDGGAIETSMPDAWASPESQARAKLAMAQAGFRDQLASFAKLQKAVETGATAAELAPLVAAARAEVAAAQSADSLKLFDEATAALSAPKPEALKTAAEKLSALRAFLERAGLRNYLSLLDDLGVEVKDVFGRDVARQEIYVTIPRRNAAAIRKFVVGASVMVGHSETHFVPHLMNSAALQNVPAAWKLGITGAGGVIEWIDTGGDAGHEDFEGRLDRVDMVHEGPEDWIGHGTHTSSISISGNPVFTGMAKAARGIMAKVFGKDSPGASDGDIMGAGTLGLQRGVDVISLSLGSRGSSADNLARFFSQLTLQKNPKGESPIVVASAGNSGPFDQTLSQPAAGEHVISVAAAAKSEDDGVPEIAFFSSVGPDRPEDYVIARERLKPDITAIGGDVVTDPGDPNVYKRGVFAAKSKDMPAGPSDTTDRKHTGMSGTSMAAPMVAGIALLVKLALRSVRAVRDFVLENLPLSVKAILLRTAKDMQVPVWFQGSGLVDAGAAVRLVLASVGGSLRARLSRIPGLGALAPPAGADSWAWIERYKGIVDLEDKVYQAAEVAKTEAQARFEDVGSDDEQAEPARKVGDKVYAEMVKKFNAARQDALPALLDALQDPVWLVRRQAALALKNMKAPQAGPALAEAAVKDEDARVRQMALLALAEAPTKAADGIDAKLKQAGADARWDVAVYASYALARRGDASAAGRLVEELGQRGADGAWKQEKWRRYSATWLLGQLGAKATPEQARALAAKVANASERANIRHLAAAALDNLARSAPTVIGDDVLVGLLAACGPDNLALTRTIAKFFPDALADAGILAALKREPARSKASDFVLRNRACAQRPGALGELVSLLARALDLPLDSPTPLPDPNGLGVAGVDPAMGPLDVLVDAPAGALDKALLEGFSAEQRTVLPVSGAVWLSVPEHKLFAFSLELRRRGLPARLARPFYRASSPEPAGSGLSVETSADGSLVTLSAAGGVSEARVMQALEDAAARAAADPDKPVIVVLDLAGQSSPSGPGPLGRLVNRLLLSNVGVVLAAGNGGPAEGSLASPADAGLGAVVAAAGEKSGLLYYSGRGSADRPGVTWTDLVAEAAAELAGKGAPPAGATAGAAIVSPGSPPAGTGVAARASAEKLAALAARLRQAWVQGEALPDGWFLYLTGLVRQTLSAMPAHKISEVGGGLFASPDQALALLLERLKDPAKARADAGALIAQARERQRPAVRTAQSDPTLWQRATAVFSRAEGAAEGSAGLRAMAAAAREARDIAGPRLDRGPPAEAAGAWWKDASATHAAETVPLFALRRDRDDPGIGKLTDLGPYFRKTLSKQGVDTVLLLPHFAVLDESPYSAVSPYAVNEDSLDWSRVPEVAGDAALLALLKAKDGLRVEYADLRAREGSVAEAAYGRFESEELARDTPRARAFGDFQAKQASWLNDYAEFMTIARALGKPALEWTPGEVAAARAGASFAASVERRKYAQWLAYGQLEAALKEVHEAGGRVLFDLPMFRSKNSVDAWKHPELFTDLKTRNPGVKNQWVNEDWKDLALWNWTRLRGDGYRAALQPYAHWLDLGFDGSRSDALHFAYRFGNGQLASGDEPGEDYVKALAAVLAARGALPLAEAFEGKGPEAEKHGFVTVYGDWKKVSTHDDPRQLGFMSRYLAQAAEGSSGRNAKFVGWTLGDEWGDPVPIKEVKDGRSYWRYRVPAPGDPGYAARVRYDARAQLAALKALREGDLWKDQQAVRAVLSEAGDGFIKHSGGSTQIWAADMDWFLEEWGRDTFVSLPGLLVSRGRYDEAKQALRRFAGFARGGLIPNRIFEDGRAEFNTVDGSLWYVAALQSYVDASGDKAFAAELAPTVKSIIERYKSGTGYERFGRFNKIFMDADGLIVSPAQATWMDADPSGRDKPVTPRDGKAVEINALWYAALRYAARVHPEYGALADKVRDSFNREFWFETEGNKKAWGGSGGALRDVVGGDPHGGAIRPNMLLAVGRGGDLLSPERRKAVVLAATRDLLTPYGLRTLSPRDSHYRARYETWKDPIEKDQAYHQGTAWPWLMGPYLDALAAVRRGQGWKDDRVAEEARGLLRPLAEFLVTHPEGSLPEVFDGGNADPAAADASLDDPNGLGALFAGRASDQKPGGTRSQAWSVAEVLRILSR